MKSILQADKECYICRKFIGSGYDLPNKGLHEHHIIFGTANRSVSEKNGLKVFLCVKHHNMVHRNYDLALILKKDAQKKYEEGHSRSEWLKLFGHNWL